MKTLVYFASGPEREEYQDLNFDKIYLIDNYFKNSNRFQNRVVSKGKIRCIGMDCLESIEYLKKEKVKIDCFVSLNEGLYEGGGSYAINSDMFLGYAMPLFKDQYIHIMNKEYYHNHYNVSMDLPYVFEEIKDNDSSYIKPDIFSKYKWVTNNAKVFIMNKRTNTIVDFLLSPTRKVKIIHDSIWNYYDYLDVLVVSYSKQGQQDFFDRIPKVLNSKSIELDKIFDYCKENKINKIGFTPLGSNYNKYLIKRLSNNDLMYLREVMMFHLNRNDYREIKEYAGNKV